MRWLAYLRAYLEFVQKVTRIVLGVIFLGAAFGLTVAGTVWLAFYSRDLGLVYVFVAALVSGFIGWAITPWPAQTDQYRSFGEDR
jgi:hypothetical protein